MENRVVIKPVKNIKAHFKTAKARMEYTKENGETEINEGQLRDRYPNTYTGTRIEWSIAKKRWEISLGEDELNNLVKRSKLSYEHGPKKGTLIETADVYDPRDPFFNHKSLRVIGQEGQISLLKDVPMDKIIYNGLENNRRFGKKGNGLVSGAIKFLISDEQGDRQFELNEVNNEIKALIEFEKLTHDKKVAIATALGFKSSETSNPDSLQLSMYHFLKSTVRNEDGLFNRDKFIALTKEDNESISIKSLLAKAKTASVIRTKKGEGFLYNGNLVAATEEEMIGFLMNPNNKDTLEKIMDAINEKS